ncbi:hypothetical protein CDL15_Pgr002183 [Punica granatum]|uniref:Uncharacterized protein n=1 Tax=Punica granatum TaxID=22663 RepID=A0A218XCT1_PUNGR|nr:hypothetical protein CDL15_Pgr002183 [Punica granatum]
MNHFRPTMNLHNRVYLWPHLNLQLELEMLLLRPSSLSGKPYLDDGIIVGCFGHMPDSYLVDGNDPLRSSSFQVCNDIAFRTIGYRKLQRASCTLNSEDSFHSSCLQNLHRRRNLHPLYILNAKEKNYQKKIKQQQHREERIDLSLALRRASQEKNLMISPNQFQSIPLSLRGASPEAGAVEILPHLLLQLLHLRRLLRLHLQQLLHRYPCPAVGLVFLTPAGAFAAFPAFGLLRQPPQPPPPEGASTQPGGKPVDSEHEEACHHAGAAAADGRALRGGPSRHLGGLGGGGWTGFEQGLPPVHRRQAQHQVTGHAGKEPLFSPNKKQREREIRPFLSRPFLLPKSISPNVSVLESRLYFSQELLNFPIKTLYGEENDRDREEMNFRRERALPRGRWTVAAAAAKAKAGRSGFLSGGRRKKRGRLSLAARRPESAGKQGKSDGGRVQGMMIASPN